MQLDDPMIEAERQLEVIAAGINGDRLKELMRSDRLAESLGGKALMKQGVEALTNTLSNLLSAHEGATHRPSSHKYIEMLGCDETAFLMSRCMLGMLGKAKPPVYHVVVALVAQRVVMAISAKLYADKDANAAEWLSKRLDWQPKSYIRERMAKEVFTDECIEVDISDTDSLSLGTTLVEAFIEALGLFEVTTKGAGKQLVKLLRVTDKAGEWLANANAMNLAMESFHLPMVIPPFDWTSMTDGGYLLPHLHQSNLIRVTKGGHGWHRLDQADLSRVMASVNAIQATPWCINDQVLDVWRALVGSGKAGMSQSEAIVVPEAIQIGEEGHDVRREERRAIFETLNRNRAIRMSETQKERVAALMQPHGTFYYPHNCDFRGRVYPLCGVGAINPQADDGGKALIKFADGKALGDDGLQWLYIHAQNTWGNDKVGLQARIDATANNLQQYLEYALDPLGNEGWHNADKPYCFLAVCFELLAISKCDNPAEFESHLAISLDGSCNGLQHFAGIMLDDGLARAVNVVGTGELPADIYQEVVRNVERLLETRSGDEADYWRGKVSRDLLKQNVMTLSYGVTAAGMRSQISDMCKKLVYRKGQLEYAKGITSPYPGYLVELVLESISTISTSAFDVMGYLRAVALANTKASPDSTAGATHWVSPIGLPITQEYYHHDTKRVNVYYEGRRIRFTRRIGATTTDGSKQSHGIAPNFIHGNDAAHLMLTVLACEEANGTPLAWGMIHDSFSTHAADTGLLFEVLRDTYVSIYREDVLMQLYEGLSVDVRAKVGPPPARGSLDLDGVQASEFMFS